MLRLINDQPVLGRRMAVEVDGGAPPAMVAANVQQLIQTGVGIYWSDSARALPDAVEEATSQEVSGLADPTTTSSLK